MAGPDPTDNPPPGDPLTTTEAAALMGWLMRDGARLRTLDVMQRTGLKYSGAYALMCRISVVIPIQLDELTGCWCVRHSLDGDNPA